jgi:predicted nuclease of restriction endonuclease-like (RecB) superfamily
MRAFYLAYSDCERGEEGTMQLPIFKIPWWHNVILLNRLEDNTQRLWYAHRAVEEGWSRSILEANIKSRLYNRSGKALNNFTKSFPEVEAALAQQSLKDPYCFDWLPLAEGHAEKSLEKGLIDHIQQLLIELGQGFAFVGRQVPLEVSGKEYFIDLLFYHYKLKNFVVVELKARGFDPRDAGQINFYLSVVDDTLRQHDDKPTIGLLLCQNKDKLTVEYALRGVNSPIGVASYETTLLEKLPKEFESSLPSVEELEAGLEKIIKT